MKANELMLRDWVKHQDTEKTVDAIWFGNQVSLNDPSKEWGSIYTDKFSADDVKPIPLTAEILEKNGFGYKEEDGNLSHYYIGDRWYLDNPDLHIGTYNKGVYWLNYLDNAIYGIKYVHQLQHALKLCHIEKEIDL